MKETLKRKRRLTLNTDTYWKRAYGKKQKYKAHENFHYRGDTKIAGKYVDNVQL